MPLACGIHGCSGGTLEFREAAMIVGDRFNSRLARLDQLALRLDQAEKVHVPRTQYSRRVPI